MHTPIIFFCYFSFSKKRFQNLHRCLILHDLVPDFFLTYRSNCVSSTFCFCCHSLQTPSHKIDRYNHNLLSYSAFLNWHTTISSDTHLNRTSFFDAWVSSLKQHHNKDTRLFFACNKRRLYLQTPQECQQFFYNRFLALAKCQFAPFDSASFRFPPVSKFCSDPERLTIINTVEKRVEKSNPLLKIQMNAKKSLHRSFFSECRDFFLPNRTKRDIIVVAAKGGGKSALCCLGSRSVGFNRPYFFASLMTSSISSRAFSLLSLSKSALMESKSVKSSSRVMSSFMLPPFSSCPGIRGWFSPIHYTQYTIS
jgi:hypothetical protein